MQIKPLEDEHLLNQVTEQLQQSGAPQETIDEVRFQFSDLLVAWCYGDKDLEEFERLHSDRIDIGRITVHLVIHKKMNVSQ